MSAVGGVQVTETVEGLERYPVNIRYPRELRDDPDRLRRVLIPTPSGAQIPLGQVADIVLRRGPPMIKSEGARPNAWVYIDLATSDVGGFVARARQVLAEQVEIPPGYTVTWSGQYEYLARAVERLRIVIPATLFLMFLLLYFNFRNVSAPLTVMLSVPFALLGGVLDGLLVRFQSFGGRRRGLHRPGRRGGRDRRAGAHLHRGSRRRTAPGEAEKPMRRGEAGSTRLNVQEIREAVRLGTSRRVRAVAMTAASTIVGAASHHAEFRDGVGRHEAYRRSDGGRYGDHRGAVPPGIARGVQYRASGQGENEAGWLAAGLLPRTA